MLMVISPSKTLDFQSPTAGLPYSEPELLDHSAELIDVLRQKSPAELAELMSISDKLAVLNVGRYQAWERPFTPDNARPALTAFKGDVYEGLDAASLDTAALQWLQQHLRILSGLYGYLRPLDLMQAYRLEMGIRLANPRGKDLYAFWGERITDGLNRALADQAPAELVNLASGEYFKSVRTGRIAARIITPVFQDWKGGHYKVISFHAKRARGLMVRWAVDRRVEQAEALKAFDSEGYGYDDAASGPDTWVFRRRQ